MTLKQYVLKWDNDWRYDFWWRQKHNVAFNSEQHRQVSQLDIAFEYLENHLSNKTIEKLSKQEEDKKLFDQGILQKDTVDKVKEDKLFEKMDMSSFA